MVDVKKVVSAAPLIRKAWRVVPGPWRVPVLVGGAAVWVYRKLKGEDEPAA